jgi:hypothetical protein
VDFSPSFSLSFGKIPFGKSPQELGLIRSKSLGWADETPMFFFPMHKSVGDSLGCSHYYQQRYYGYDSSSMYRIKKKNFEIDDQIYDVNFYFTNNSGKLTLAVVDKSFEHESENLQIQDFFKSMMLSMSTKIGSSPIGYNFSEENWDTYYETEFTEKGRFALWKAVHLTPVRVVALKSIYDSVSTAMRERPVRDIRIIVASENELLKYKKLNLVIEKEKMLETEKRRSSIINSAF